MGRRWTISRLPRVLREQIDQLMDEGHTIDELMTHQLEARGIAGVSRSAMGRYTQSIHAVSERLRRGREMADALVRQYGEAEGDKKRPKQKEERLHDAATPYDQQITDHTSAPP